MGERTLEKYIGLFTPDQQHVLAKTGLVKETDAAKKAGKAEAKKMKEMMARCKDFVKQNAASFEEREREVAEKEKMARRAEEWEEIATWHQPLEEKERKLMKKEDEFMVKYRKWKVEESRRQEIERQKK